MVEMQNTLHPQAHVSVKSTLPAMPVRGRKIEEALCAVELAACYLGED